MISKLCQAFNKNSGKYFCKRIAGAKALSYFKISRQKNAKALKSGNGYAIITNNKDRCRVLRLLAPFVQKKDDGCIRVFRIAYKYVDKMENLWMSDGGSAHGGLADRRACGNKGGDTLIKRLFRDERKRRLFSEGVFSACLFLAALFFVYRMAVVDFDPHHSGLMYKSALDVARGKVLFLETFTQYGALVTYLQSLAILVLGERVRSILFSTAFFYAADYLLFYLFSRRFLPRLPSFLATLTLLFLAPYYTWPFQPWSSVYALFFFFLCIFFTLRALERISPLYGFLAGAAAMLCFWCRQPVGLVTLLGVLICFSLPLFFAPRACRNRGGERFALCFFALCGAVLAFAALFLPIYLSGAAGDFYQQSIKGMLAFAVSSRPEEGSAFLNVFYRLIVAPFTERGMPFLGTVWLFLPLCSLALFAGGVRAYRRALREGGEKAACRALLLSAFAVLAVSAWHQYYPVSCYRHWYWGAFPSVFSAFYLGFRFLSILSGKTETGKKPRVAAALFLLCAVVILGSNASYRFYMSGVKIVRSEQAGKFSHPVYTHLDGLYLDKDVALYYKSLFDYVNNLQTVFPERNIINTTENGLYAVFGQENIGPLFNNAGNFYYENYTTSLAEYIRIRRPIVIGSEPPGENYVFLYEPPGDHADPCPEYHHLPARIWLPAELYAQWLHAGAVVKEQAP